MLFWSGGMHKIVLCVSLLFNTINFKEGNRTVVESIVHNTNKEDVIELEIELYSNNEDIVEMSIYFYDEKMEDKYDEYFSSSLLIKGSKTTTATIPFEKKEKVFLNIIFFSNDLAENIADIFFPIYKANVGVCKLSDVYYCQSGAPSVIEYKNGEIKEFYDKFFLVNKNNEFYSFRNYIMLDKIKLSASMWQDVSANLYIEEEIEGLNLYYDSGYVVPLIVNFEDGIITFNLANNYYLDVLHGKTYEDYKDGTVFSNNILLPYRDNEYDMSIEIDGLESFTEVIINFKTKTNGMFYGACKESKYCLRRDYSI